MKNYLATKWKSLLAWSSATWRQGLLGKVKVVLAWYGVVVVVMAPIGWLMPGVELELRPAMKQPALLCHQQQSFDEIIGAEDMTNQALREKFRRQPDVLARIVTSDSYMQRSSWAFYQERMRKIARGQCREVTHGDPVTADWMEWQSSKDAEPLKPKRMQVIYQGQKYWAYAGEWQKVTGNAVAEQDRALLMISRKSSDGNDRSAPPVVDEFQERSRAHRHPLPPFSRNESYAKVRMVLLSDGWQPVISKDADQCMDGDSRCEGRPEMLTCSGSGLAMCRFRWRREGQEVTICTAGEEPAMFHSVCQ